MKEEINVYIASDHAGFEVKEKLKRYLHKKGFNCDDLGAYQYKEDDDYPDYAFKLAQKVSRNNNSLGILICGTGAGMAIAANKVKWIRAVEAYDIYSAKMSKEHNDANVLALGARTLSFEKIKKIVNVWFKTPFSNEKRHKRRIEKIDRFEKG